MLSVILMILKIIGIVLLGLLGLVIVLLLLLLLVPVRYRGKAAKEENITADIHATWLLHLVHVILTYGPDGLGKKVKVFGISLKSFETVPEKKTDEEEPSGDGEAVEEKKENAAEESDVKTSGETDDKSDQSKTEADDKAEAVVKDEEKTEVKAESAAEGSAKTESGVITENTGDKNPGHKVGRKKKKNGDKTEDTESEEEKPGFFERLEKKKTDIAEKLNNIYNKITHYKEIIDDPRFRNGIRYGLNRLFAALKHILPRKLKGYAHYGFEDPSTTGYITAGVGILYGPLHDFMRFEPDFENEVLEGHAEFRGHARLGTVLFIALQVILKKDCRFVYKSIKAEGND